jgi:hypothetical protein
LDRRLGGPQSRSGHEEVKILDSTGLELQPLGRLACTDYAIPAFFQNGEIRLKYRPIVYEEVHCIHLALQAFMNTVMKLGFDTVLEICRADNPLLDSQEGIIPVELVMNHVLYTYD